MTYLDTCPECGRQYRNNTVSPLRACSVYCATRDETNRDDDGKDEALPTGGEDGGA